jgi:hypothetical protein
MSLVMWFMLANLLPIPLLRLSSWATARGRATR